MSPQSKAVRLDGTTLEGGGQILRLALALSSLTGKAIQLEKIRGNRGTKPQDGGIKQAHLGGAAWLAMGTEASTEGMALRSRELLFEPGRGTAHEIREAQKAVERDGVTLRPELRKVTSSSKSSHLDPLWTDIMENGQLVRRESSLALTTPGSVFSILQATLPFILFRSQINGSRVPLRMTIHGGTNVWHSMSYEWAEHVLFPMLHSKLGIGPIAMKLHERSWSTGARSIGSVTFDIPPLADPSKPLPAFSFTDRGSVTKISIFIYAPDTAWRSSLLECTTMVLEQRFPDVEQEIAIDAPSGHRARLYLLLVAHTSNGYRLGRDWLYAEKMTDTKRDQIAEKVARRVVEDLCTELAHGGCVDEYLHDQLVVFQTIAEGTSVVHRPGPPSLHAQTARWVANEICGVRFDDQGSCTGIGYCEE